MQRSNGAGGAGSQLLDDMEREKDRDVSPERAALAPVAPPSPWRAAWTRHLEKITLKEATPRPAFTKANHLMNQAKLLSRHASLAPAAVPASPDMLPSCLPRERSWHELAASPLAAW